MSKYIPKSRLTKQEPFLWSNFQSTWRSKPVKVDLNENKEIEDYYEKLEAEKSRIENIPIDDLCFKNLYTFPFRQAKFGLWVYDNNGNFIFQFENGVSNDTRERCLQILNGEHLNYNRVNLEAKNGQIFVDGKEFITIRGWGNLTGVGAYNLSGEYASKIQDTLLDYIADKLKK